MDDWTYPTASHHEAPATQPARLAEDWRVPEARVRTQQAEVLRGANLEQAGAADVLGALDLLLRFAGPRSAAITI
jgi:hypothetical protein